MGAPLQRPSGGRRGGRRGAPMAEINVTPVVDVVLVLLIVFMIAAPLLVTGAAVDLPQTGAEALPQDVEPISVSLDAQGQRWVDEDPLAGAAFVERLALLAQARGRDTRVLIRADQGIAYGQVAALLADVTGAGFSRVALVNRPEGP